MGDIGSASSAVRLHELSVDSLPAKTRMVLEGIDRLLVYSIPMRLRFRNIEVREGLLLHGEYGWENAHLSGIMTRVNPLPGLLAHWRLPE